MSKISEKNIFYKLYLYYNLYIRHKAFKVRATYSQNQEDLFINNYFKDKKHGFYLDIGCYHPIKYSNTALLHNRGWQGINIDMNQTLSLIHISEPTRPYWISYAVFCL